MSAVAPVRTRILVVLHDLSLGGTERIAIRLANAWSAMGREVTLLCGEPRGPSAALVGPDVERVSADPTTSRGPGAVRRLGRAVARRLAEHPADLLFVPGNHHWPIVPAAARLPEGVRPRIVVQVSNPMRRSGRGLLRQALFDARARRLMTGADAAVTLTEAERREADAVLRRPVATHIPLPALDDDTPPPRPRSPRPPLVLCVGRLVPQKGFDLALAAFARIATPGARLIVAGSGPWRASLERMAAALDVSERVVFLGYVEDVRPLMDRAGALLVLSRFEGYAAVVVEALAAGLPVVATATVPAAVDLVTTPERGIVVETRDPAEIADALDRTLTPSPDRPPEDPFALAAAVEGHRLSPVARAYLDLFDGA